MMVTETGRTVNNKHVHSIFIPFAKSGLLENQIYYIKIRSCLRHQN